MNMVNELAMLRMEKAALTDSNQNKDEIILSLANENKNLKNDSSCLLRNHLGVMVEKNEVVREKNELKEQLDVNWRKKLWKMKK